MKLHLHEFKRERNGQFCYLCQDSWPANETAVSKYDICIHCGVTVHTGCRDFAKTCYPCIPSSTHQKLTSQYLHDINRSGRVFASLIHAYDLGIPAGTQLYGVFKVSTCQELLRTNLVTSGEHDCVWDTSHKITFDPTGELPASPQRIHTEDQVIAGIDLSAPALRHIYHPRDHSGAVFAPPLFHLEIWKSFLGLFDSKIATCDMSLLPLLLHPSISIERWFGLRNSEGTKGGMVLLKLCFVPDETVPAASTPTSPIERPVVTFCVMETSDEDIDRLVVSGKDSNVDHSGGIVTSEDSEDEVEIAPSTDTNNKVLDDIIPVVDSFPLDENIVESTSDSATLTPNTLPVPDVDNSKVHPTDQTDLSDARSTPQTPPSTKWQDWLQITSDQLSKSMKERGTAALDVLSTLTSSGTIRKRKRNSANPSAGDDTMKTTGVGTLHVELVSAYKSFATDAAEGDHFAVVNVCTCGSLALTEPLIDTNQERETQIVKSSAAPVFNEKYEFIVPHYRTALKLTLVDAVSEKQVGVSVLHLYALIQRDADKYNGKWDAAEIENVPMKDLNGKNIIGYFTVRVRFQEDIQGLFVSSDPRKAPPGPSEAMSLERVQVHVRRFGKFIEVLTKLFRRYRSLMDWENPPFTFAIFVLFVYFTLYLDAEYALCAPLFILVALLTETWIHREFGYFKKKWVVTEDDSLNYPYRPVSYLRLAVAGFRNFGLKGVPKTPPPYVRITLLPDGDNSGKLSASPQTEYHIATFSTSMDRQGGIISRNNIESSRQKSSGIGQFISSLSLSKNDAVLKDALLQNVSDPWVRHGESSDEHVDISYVYPILQKISDNPVGQTTDDDKQKVKKKKSNFVPWSKSPAVIKFSFHGDNPLSSFLDNAWGSVQIPISELVGEELKYDDGEEIPGVQEEVRVWKDIVWTSAHLQRLRTMQEEEDVYVENIGDLDNPYAMFAPRESGKGKSKEPLATSQVLLRLQLDIRQSSLQEPLPDDLEISRVVQSIIMPKNEKSQTAISAIWNARDHIKYVQNLMGGVIDKLESFKNIFNWTIPSKTFPLYAMLVGIWLATVFIPGRYLILLVGFSEFFFIFMPQPEELPLTIKVMNLITSLPNDDDLFEIYRAERETNGAAFEEKQRERLKQVKLRLVLDCRWDGAVKIKQPGAQSIWMDAYLVIQGHRLVWWATENDVHEGNAPVGEILLQGHAGTTHASPVDIREVGNDLRLVVVFGRDALGGQIKRTILCQDPESCESLKSLVNSLLNDVHTSGGRGRS